MFVKKQRTHSCGNSNIDFRTLKDHESLKKFQPWKVRKNFGTMGNSDYHLKFKEYKELMHPTQSLNTTYDKKNEIPNPKFYNTAVLYSLQRIKAKPEAFHESDKIAELDEVYKGKERFTGDSMMIAQITKIRKKGSSMFEKSDKANKAQKIGHLAKEKKEKNKDTIQETQIVKIDKTSDTADHKIDVEKVNEIRFALRRRYANRTNFRKIFKDWDKENKGEIQLRDAKEMINRFGININFNETKALFMSTSTRHTESLNLDEFMNLIFTDNAALNIDINKFQYKDENIYEGEKIEAFNKDLQLNAGVGSKKLETEFLHNYLRIRIPVLAKAFKNFHPDGKTECDYNTFKKTIQSLNIHNKYTNDDLLTFIFNKHRNKNNEMNFQSFIEDLHTNKTDIDFYGFKDNVYNKMIDKIAEQKQRLVNTANNLKSNPSLGKYLEMNHELIKNPDIENRLVERERLFSDDVDATRPSEAFFAKVWKDNRAASSRRLDVIKSISPIPLLESTKNTRRGAKPSEKNTFDLLQARPGDSMYISEKERFNIRGRPEVDFQAEQKLHDTTTKRVRMEKLKEYEIEVKNKNFMTDLVIEEKKNYSMLQRAQKMLIYETKCKNRNSFIE